MYTTPKKIKHKRKKTKLAVLKYYKVDGDGKIERLRRECPTAEVRLPKIKVRIPKLTETTVRGWCFYGCDAQPPILWQVSSDVCLR